MQKNGYRESTIRGTVHTLKAVGRKCNLLEPEFVKAHLNGMGCGFNRKEKIWEDLDRFYKYKGIAWVKQHAASARRHLGTA